MKAKKILIWIFAFIITILLGVYQRLTGPTYPTTDKFEYQGKTYKIVYLRSHSTSSDAVIAFKAPEGVYGFIYQRVYPLTDVGYTALRLRRSGDSLVGIVTKLPPAGKMQYYIELYSPDGKVIYTRKDDPVIIRFKGDVPAGYLIAHVIFMFLAVWLGLVAGIFALFKIEDFVKVQKWTLFATIIGGLILGPIVQKYAFGQYWTGVPFGWDLTDNKTLIMFIVWLIAVLVNRKQPRPGWTIAASIIQLIVYFIPHSLFGSTLDPRTGKVTQGGIFMLFKRRKMKD